jgi:hypothetical protein
MAAGGSVSWVDQLRDLPSLLANMLRELRGGPRQLLTLGLYVYYVKLGVTAVLCFLYLVVRCVPAV